VIVVCAVSIVTPAAASATSAQISATPALYPAFNPSVTDYVTRCTAANQVSLSVSAPAGTVVSIDSGAAQGGSFTQVVSLSAGQSFAIAVTTAGQTWTYYIRCLPSDFPAFSAIRSGTPQFAFVAVAPNLYLPPAGVSWRYVALFDTNGVPVWWMLSVPGSVPDDVKLLSNEDVIWTHAYGSGGAGAEEHRLDGTLVRIVNTVGSGADHHDVQLLPNGDYLMGRTFARTGVDMSSCGGSTSGTLLDFELQELTPSGGLVWSWRASNHIPVSEVAPQFKSNCLSGGDVYHWNSVEPDGTGYILSFRSLDAVYRIDATTGAITWKLGGTPRPESLTVVGDPDAPNTLCGQHDARLLPDGTLTVHDNGTNCNRAPRVVRYMIDTTARTATLVESLTRPFSWSWCCGSTSILPGGDWLTDWGASRYVMEQTPSGSTVFQLAFTQALSSYRANPILPGQVTAAQLRAGMDTQYPRP
jgi:hypothetical protein